MQNDQLGDSGDVFARNTLNSNEPVESEPTPPLEEQTMFRGLRDWPLFKSYEQHYRNDVENPGALIHGLLAFLVECRNFKEIRCACCHGHGHHSKVCPSLGRLRKVATGHTLAQRLLTKALDSQQPNRAFKGKNPRTGTNIAYTMKKGVR